MNRIGLGLMILVGGAAAFGGLHYQAQQLREETRSQQISHTADVERLAAIAGEKQILGERLQLAQAGAKQQEETRALTRRANEFRPYFSGTELHPAISAATSEALRAELDCSWQTTGPFVVVSKPTLHDLVLGGIKANRVSDAAAEVLALTSAERATVDVLIQETIEQLRSSVQTTVLRSEPEPDYPLKWIIPGNATLTAERSRAFANQIATLIGPERSPLFLRYAAPWLFETGLKNLAGEDTMISVHRHGRSTAGPEQEIVVRTGGLVNSIQIRPNQPMPLLLQLLYPGGWVELANAEGLELSQDFNKAR